MATMSLNVEKELADLRKMTVTELRGRYAEAFGEATKVRHRAWLVKRIIWRLQTLAEGDLSERARRRAAELANDADLRLAPPKCWPTGTAPTATVDVASPRDIRLPPPGSILTRQYKGRSVQVRVLAEGFEFEGDFYRSLSAIAIKVTGSHCSGHRFFRLVRGGVQ
jgi:hypothetical protein